MTSPGTAAIRRLRGTVVVPYVGLSLANVPCPALDLQLMDNHLCGQTIRYKSTNQANSACHPVGVDK